MLRRLERAARLQPVDHVRGVGQTAIVGDGKDRELCPQIAQCQR